MDIFLIMIIFIIAFCVLRSYLRGTILSIMDILSFVLSIITGLALFKGLGYMLYTTKLYTGASKGFAGMLNFNSIMENSKSQFDSIATADIVVPNIISDFFNKNNTLEVYKNNGIESFDDYIIEVFTHIIIVSVAFLLIFIVAYFIFNLLRIIIMPHINIVSFGIADSIIACILGFVKGVIIIFLGCAFVPVSFIQFNYATIYNMICSSPALLFFYNNNIIIKSLLNGINLS